MTHPWRGLTTAVCIVLWGTTDRYNVHNRSKSSKEPWYILTNLDNLSAAQGDAAQVAPLEATLARSACCDAYAKRMGIEEAMP